MEKQTTTKRAIRWGWLLVRSPAVVNALNGESERTRSCKIDDADAVPLENTVPLDAQCEAAMWEDRGEWMKMVVNHPDLRRILEICRS